MDNLHLLYKDLKDKLVLLLENDNISYSIKERHNGYIVYSSNPHYSCAMHDYAIDSKSRTIELVSTNIKSDDSNQTIFITRISVEGAANLIKYIVKNPTKILNEDEAYKLAN